MATWNVTGLGDHIPEIVEIMKKRKIAVLGISDSRTKGSGSKQIDSNFVYTWSGRDTHADHGVGFIVDEQHSQAIVEIRPINLRLIHMKIQAKNTVENYIQCYAPLNTDEEDVKDEFFENLHDTLADIPSSEQIYLMGDFNGKVGHERRMYTDYLGPHGRGTRNDNGETLLEICASHHICISNTFFQHQDSHAYTWYKWGDQTVRSQIDYIITRRK